MIEFRRGGEHRLQSKDLLPLLMFPPCAKPRTKSQFLWLLSLLQGLVSVALASAGRETSQDSACHSQVENESAENAEIN